MQPDEEEIIGNLFLGFVQTGLLLTRIDRQTERKDKDRLTNSATRFGEILPYWPKFKLIWQSFEGLLSIWQILYPFGRMFIVVNSSTMKKLICHLVTLQSRTKGGNMYMERRGRSRRR